MLTCCVTLSTAEGLLDGKKEEEEEEEEETKTKTEDRYGTGHNAQGQE